jgi:hypothetical protein
MRTLARIVIGLIAACLTAAFVVVLHVITPTELAGLTGDALSNRLIRFGDLVLLTATQQALVIVPLALIAIAVAELNRWRSWILYAIIGCTIAAAGFYLQLVSENELRTVANTYAARAYALEGLSAAWVYWLIAGRFAGWRRGGGLVKATPYPLGSPRLRVSDVENETTAAQRG